MKKDTNTTHKAQKHLSKVPIDNLDVAGLIFDYGGTLDTPAVHWSEVLWEGYQHVGVPVDKEAFREAYVHGERTLAKEPLIKPEHNFHDLLVIKVNVEMEYLREQGVWPVEHAALQKFALAVADYCYAYVQRILTENRPVLDTLSARFPMVLVSNFYGNIQTILKDFRLDGYFQTVIESAVVGVRKPDPAIYEMGVRALRLYPHEVLVVGDSFSKDIVPARTVGCRTAWLRGIGWGNEVVDENVPDAVLTRLTQLPKLLGVSNDK